MLIRKLLLILSAFLFSGCSLLDYVQIAESETSILESDLGEAPPNLAWEDNIFDLGSFCWTGGNVAMCVDKMAPEYTEDQHHDVPDAMELVFAEPLPNSISVSLYPGSNFFAQETIPLEASMDANGLILLSLPEDLQGLYILAVFATWEGGDAFYTLPIRLG
jgi:hypothetical protein